MLLLLCLLIILVLMLFFFWRRSKVVSKLTASGMTVIQGIQGIEGIMGIEGIQGIQGIQGIKGDAGPPAGLLHFSSGVATGYAGFDEVLIGVGTNANAGVVSDYIRTGYAYTLAKAVTLKTLDFTYVVDGAAAAKTGNTFEFAVRIWFFPAAPLTPPGIAGLLTTSPGVLIFNQVYSFTFVADGPSEQQVSSGPITLSGPLFVLAANDRFAIAFTYPDPITLVNSATFSCTVEL